MAAAAAAAAAVATAAAVAGVVPSPNRVYYVVDPKEVMAQNQSFMCPFLARWVGLGCFFWLWLGEEVSWRPFYVHYILASLVFGRPSLLRVGCRQIVSTDIFGGAMFLEDLARLLSFACAWFLLEEVVLVQHRVFC